MVATLGGTAEMTTVCGKFAAGGYSRRRFLAALAAAGAGGAGAAAVATSILKTVTSFEGGDNSSSLTTKPDRTAAFNKA
jgi:hypothetical protein